MLYLGAMRAMILAAGLGTRLAPLTERLPKPLVPVVGVPNIVRTIGRLKAVGIEQIVINTHWLPEVLKARLGDGRMFGVSIAYSDEPALLGTGGGIWKALPLFRDESFIVINGDALVAPDFARIIQFHEKKKALATLVVRKDPAAEKYGAVGVNPDGRVERLVYGGQDTPLLANYMFTGVHIMDPAAARMLPEKGCVVRDLYIPMVARGASIFALPMEGFFCDLGTLERYWRANIDLVTGKKILADFTPPRGAVFVGENVQMDDRAVLGPGTVLCDGAVVKGDVHIERSVVLEGGCVRESVKDAIVTSDGSIVSIPDSGR